MDQKTYQAFRNAVTLSEISRAMESNPVVAVLSGPAPVIECVVQEASRESGIPMDWAYSGGRAYVHADGDTQKARDALVWKMPTGLSLADLGQPARPRTKEAPPRAVKGRTS